MNRLPLPPPPFGFVSFPRGGALHATSGFFLAASCVRPSGLRVVFAVFVSRVSRRGSCFLLAASFVRPSGLRCVESVEPRCLLLPCAGFSASFGGGVGSGLPLSGPLPFGVLSPDVPDREPVCVPPHLLFPYPAGSTFGGPVFAGAWGAGLGLTPTVFSASLWTAAGFGVAACTGAGAEPRLSSSLSLSFFAIVGLAFVTSGCRLPSRCPHLHVAVIETLHVNMRVIIYPVFRFVVKR